MDAIANLETATASNRSAIAQLTATVERLTAEIVTVNAKLVTALRPSALSGAAVEDEAADADVEPALQQKPTPF